MVDILCAADGIDLADRRNAKGFGAIHFASFKVSFQVYIDGLGSVSDVDTAQGALTGCSLGFVYVKTKVVLPYNETMLLFDVYNT